MDLISFYSKVRLYREWNLGSSAPLRVPQKADLPNDILLEDLSNLGLILNHLQNRRENWKCFIDQFRKFYPTAEEITTKIQGGTVQIFLHEKGLKRPIPATRLSDGILQYLALLTILCHTDPPPLVCIEEPELGLHPDILSNIAELLIEASHRTQLIITTHSDILVSALSEVPESVLICERDERGTSMRRLQKEKLEEWLKKYSLGELWRIGELGGKRW
jgi:predicted ATPase